MEDYSRLFGSQFPDSALVLTGYKDIGEATDAEKELIQQYYTYIDAKDYVNATTLLTSNWDVLNPYYFGMEILNKLEEELYNTQTYALKNNTVVISSDEPNILLYTFGTPWLKPV